MSERQRNGPVNPRSVSKRARIAHHEAGHAVLSAAINDAPHLVSIRDAKGSLGRARYRMEVRPERLIQVHLAGFAAEEILKGRRSRQLFGFEMGASITALTEPALASLGEGLETCDQYLAVREVLKMGDAATPQEIRAEIERFYNVAMESLRAVWQVVVAVAKALLRHTEIDRDGFHDAVGDHDIYTPVFVVQDAHGLRSPV